MEARRRLWLYAGISVAAGVGLVIAAQERPTTAPPGPPAPPAPPGAPRLGQATRALLLGDSFAVGLATPLRQVVEGLGGKLQADGRVGTRIAQWQEQPWLDAALASRPNLVLVSLGTNDMRMADPSVERTALAALIERVRRTGARLVWIEPPTVPFPDHGVRTMIAKTGVERFPSMGLQIPRGPDNLHPTAAGYAGWAGAIARWLG